MIFLCVSMSHAIFEINLYQKITVYLNILYNKPTPNTSKNLDKMHGEVI